MSDPKIAILLATYNGGKFIAQQLESFRAQTHENWELYVSDDGSADETREIVMRFAASVPQRVEVLQGPRLGFWQNFVSLVRRDLSDADLFAFSDQDDIWLADKLATAVAWFKTQPPPQTPALYFTRTELIADDGAPLGLSPLFTRAPDFRNALVQNIGGGNTMVFNRAARDALCATPADIPVVSHDWWAYQVITGVGGRANYDSKPSVRYRQHGQNLVGGNVGMSARISRLFAFAGGRLAAWNEINVAFLQSIRPALTQENAAVLDGFVRARMASWATRLWLLHRSGVHRQSFVENAGLALGALFGRI